MRNFEPLLLIVYHYIVIQLLCPQRAARTRKLSQIRTNRKMKRE